VPERVRRCDGLGAVVDRLRPDETIGAGARQRANRAREALLGQPLRLAPARPESGAPQQALGLGETERPSVDGKGSGRDLS
jgi:hypothetical protein